MKAILSRISWPRFQLQSLLLATLVAATASDVFLRPKTTVVTLAGTLKIESSRRVLKPTDGSQQPKVMEQGAWRLLTHSGKLLAVGYHEQGHAVGPWRYFDDRGQVRAEGPCANGQPCGRWVNRAEEGTIIQEVTLPKASAPELSANDRELVANRNMQTSRQAAPVPSVSRILPVSSVSIDEAKRTLRSARYRDRCLALHQLTSHGDAALPALIEIVEERDHPVRLQAFRWIKSYGPQAHFIAARLKAVADSSTGNLRSEMLATLMAIDPDRRRDYVQCYLEDVAVHQSCKAAELYSVLAQKPETFVQDLALHKADQRLAVRQLITGLLLHRLDHMTFAKGPSAGWYSDFFKLGLTDRDGVEDMWNNADTAERCQEIIEQLESLQSDPDPEIRAAVAMVLPKWKAETILPSSRATIGFGPCF